jgi:hypothetical protein
MLNRTNPFRPVKMLAAASIFVGGLVLASGALAQTPTASRIRGEIVSVGADSMVVHRTNADNVTVDLKPDTPVAALKSLKLSDIKPGSFVGATSVPGADGKLMAREVHVFPEALRGRGEGHRDWDLLPGSSMTNANVDTVVQGNNGRELTMSYKGGTKVIVVPESTPVVTYIDASLKDVVAGKKVFIIATSTGPGKYSADRITVEKDGVPPPM